MAAEAKKKFVPPNPCVLLWDEKKIERNKQKEVRMMVMVAGDERPPNMIGSYSLADGKGNTVAETVVKKAKDTMVENRKKRRHNSNLINHFPTSEGVSQVSEQANE